MKLIKFAPRPMPRRVAEIGPLMAAGLPMVVAETVLTKLELLDQQNHPPIASSGSGTRKW